MHRNEKLKQIVNRRAAVSVPGAANPLFALVAEQAGFEAVYVTGAGIANMNHGLPDIGLVTVTEIVQATHSISDVVDLPLIVDADTGFGNALNTIRAVRQLEKAGASAIQLEDQVFPKRCGHFEGKSVVPAAEMVQKIKAAVDARRNDNMMIIARTDARAIEGFESALERSHVYAEAGADLIFLEAPMSAEEMERIPQEIRQPTVANIVFGGKTPDLGQAELARMGFSIVLYANAILQAVLKTSAEVLQSLNITGSLNEVRDHLASFNHRQAVVHKDEWDRRDASYATP